MLINADYQTTKLKKIYIFLFNFFPNIVLCFFQVFIPLERSHNQSKMSPYIKLEKKFPNHLICKFKIRITLLKFHSGNPYLNQRTNPKWIFQTCKSLPNYNLMRNYTKLKQPIAVIPKKLCPGTGKIEWGSS